MLLYLYQLLLDVIKSLLKHVTTYKLIFYSQITIQSTYLPFQIIQTATNLSMFHYLCKIMAFSYLKDYETNLNVRFLLLLPQFLNFSGPFIRISLTKDSMS